MIDRDGRIIAGNKTASQADDAGIKDVIVVESDGSKLIAVKRTDLSLDDPKAQALAVADNRAGELGLEWDSAVMAELSSDLDLRPFFAAHELAEITGDGSGELNDVQAEYEGMPEYTSEDETGVRKLIVHFRTHEDVAEFARVIGQDFSRSAKFIWFPRAERADLASQKYVHDTATIPDIRTDTEPF